MTRLQLVSMLSSSLWGMMSTLLTLVGLGNCLPMSPLGQFMSGYFMPFLMKLTTLPMLGTLIKLVMVSLKEVHPTIPTPIKDDSVTLVGEGSGSVIESISTTSTGLLVGSVLVIIALVGGICGYSWWSSSQVATPSLEDVTQLSPPPSLEWLQGIEISQKVMVTLSEDDITQMTSPSSPGIPEETLSSNSVWWDVISKLGDLW